MSRPVTEHAAYVFDLDGVVRDFAPGDQNPVIEAALSLPPGTVAATAFRPDLLEPTITGQQTFDQWYGAICTVLEAAVPEPERVREHMEKWRAHRGAPIEETVERLRTLRQGGHRTYLFTNGTDHIPDELELLGLTELFDAVLNSAELGVAKPASEAFAAAHGAIESDLGRPVAHPHVWFTDDRPDNVAGALQFGWDAILFRPMDALRPGGR